MSLLTKIRQDADGVAASAEEKLRQNSAGLPPSLAAIALPANAAPVPAFSLVAAPTIAQPDAWTLPAMYSPGGVPIGVVAFHEGDWGPVQPTIAATAKAPGLREPARPLDLPQSSPTPCPKCSCEFWWQTIGDIAGLRLNCCECRSIPSRRIVIGLWLVECGPDGSPQWASWSPRHWRPFAHLEAAEAKQRATAGAAAKKANEGF